MTKLLLKIFIKGNTADPSVRSRIGKLSGIVGILCNLLLFGAKLFIGMVSGSVSITADAMNNLSDATGSVVTFLGFKLAEKPADADHPYGHARFEYISGLAVSALILLIGFELGKSSFDKILHPQKVKFTPILAGILLFSIAVKLWLYFFSTALSEKIGSATLKATASDSRNDVLTTAAVLGAAFAEHMTGLTLDGYVGMGVALFILYSGLMLAKETISPLLGEAANPELKKDIAEMIKSFPKVLGYHDLMVHDYGPGKRFASMHVEMDRAEDPMECHDIIDNLERECFQRFNVHLVVHYDPIVTGDEVLEEMRSVVKQILSTVDPELHIHDFRMVQGSDHTNLVFDMVLPERYESPKQKREIKEYLDRELNKKEGGPYYTVITFDMAAFS